MAPLLLWAVPHLMLLLDPRAPWLVSERLRIQWPTLIDRTLEVDYRKSKLRGRVVSNREDEVEEEGLPAGPPRAAPPRP